MRDQTTLARFELKAGSFLAFLKFGLQNKIATQQYPYSDFLWTFFRYSYMATDSREIMISFL